jgi:hypothetical protein
LLGEAHFIKQIVNASMTKPTEIKAFGHLFACVGFAEVSAAVHFFRDQMVEGQINVTPAKRAGAQLCRS